MGVLLIIAMGVGFVGWLWIVVMAFSEDGALWGIGCLIIPLVAIIYGAINFHEAKVPLALLGGGTVARVVLVLAGGA